MELNGDYVSEKARRETHRACGPCKFPFFAPWATSNKRATIVSVSSTPWYPEYRIMHMHKIQRAKEKLSLRLTNRKQIYERTLSEKETVNAGQTNSILNLLSLRKSDFRRKFFSCEGLHLPRRHRRCENR